MSSLDQKLDDFRIRLEEIKSGTANFSSENHIGGGGFGKVYKGKLSNSRGDVMVAIKQLNPQGWQGKHEFKNEVSMLYSYKHKNIVTFVGYCDEGGQMIIVYEYAVNESLDKHLRDTQKMRQINWERRLKIGIGAAEGLDYLHSGIGADLRVIHRDIKSSNILLDKNWEAKVSDFGLSKFAPKNQPYTQLNTRVAGTDGYCDPYYYATNTLTKESDVYSFGVVLFELLCGRLVFPKNNGNDDDVDSQNLVALVHNYYKDGLDMIIDPYISDEIKYESLHMFKEIAYQCLTMDYTKRPKMSDVVKQLKEALNIQIGRPWGSKEVEGSNSIKMDTSGRGGPTTATTATAAAVASALASHGGRFTEYNSFGTIFEVTAKYKPPIMPIGKGAYGIVCSALNSETNERVAIKKIANAFENKIDAKRTLREIKILRHMDHENVVVIRDIIPPPQGMSFNDVYIAYELMDTDLHQIIRSNQSLSEEHSQYFLYQILRGLKYIHSANVLHRDLKPSNLHLNANCDLKICEFGSARVASETDFMTEYVVTRWYRAPELLLNSSDYSAAIDVWSVGCIFLELMDRKPLFPGRDHVHQLRLLMELIGTPSEAELGFLNENGKRYIRQLPLYRRQSFTEKFPQVHPAAIDLIEKMLTFDPRQRITVEEALAHPYLASLHDINDEPVCMSPFSFDFEQHVLTEEEMMELIYREALAFNPEYQHM